MYEKKNIRGVNPIIDEIKNFFILISKIDKQIFWINKGVPIINLRRIRYSIEDDLINLFNFFEYF